MDTSNPKDEAQTKASAPDHPGALQEMLRTARRVTMTSRSTAEEHDAAPQIPQETRMPKIYAYEPVENAEAEEPDDRVVLAVSEESFKSRNYEEYEEEVLEVMADLGFMDVMAFSYQHESASYEESLEILKKDPRIEFVKDPAEEN